MQFLTIHNQCRLSTSFCKSQWIQRVRRVLRHHGRSVSR